MVKLNERLALTLLATVPTVFLLVILYHELSYMKSLETKFEIRNEQVFSMPADSPSSDNSLKTSTGYPQIIIQVVPTTTRKTTTYVSNYSEPRENLFKDLHKYSAYNPDFRFLMNWPPNFTESPINPNLADKWYMIIEDFWPSWKKFHYKISKLYMYEDDEFLEELLHDLATKKIVAVEPHPGGTQFKLIITYENGGKALFKPQRYPKDQEVHENMLYLSDFERHFSEIASFHLDKVMGFRRTVPVVGRKINVTGELYPLADNNLINTFYLSPEGNYCFYGKCKLYCDIHHGFCGNPHMLEGSFAVYLPTWPRELLAQRLIRSPWRRTYMPMTYADWEKDEDYCQNVVIKAEPFVEGRRLYDVIDVAIFDFLIGNEDRHHYDEFTVFGNDSTSTVVLMDNGRGFGKSYHDEMSILSPLMQCCLVRLSTFNKLYSFHAGPRPLSEIMRESLAKDPLAPILTEAHLQALDRRVDIVLSIIEECLEVNLPGIVFLDDKIDY